MKKALKKYLPMEVPGTWYQPGGDGGRGLSAEVSTLIVFVKPAAGFAGMLIEKTCGMRAMRPRRKTGVGDIVVDGKRESWSPMQVQKAKREDTSRELQVRRRAGRGFGIGEK